MDQVGSGIAECRASAARNDDSNRDLPVRGVASATNRVSTQLASFPDLNRELRETLSPVLAHLFGCLGRISCVRRSGLFEFGRAKGHGSLSDGQPVLFAGEMEINEQGQLTRWNNMSGTYCFPEQHAFQAGLPLVSFWGVVERPQTQDSSDWLEVSNDVWLHRVDPSDAPLPLVTMRHPQQMRLTT